jgi:hypothetical protein
MNLGHIEKLQRIPLADLLVEEGVLERSTVDDAQIQQDAEGKELGEVLVEREILSDYDLAKIVATHYSLPYLDVAGFSTKREVVELLPLETCMRHAILPLDRFGPLLTLAVSEVPSPEVVREIVSRTKLVPTLFVAMRRGIVTVLEEEKKRRDSRSTGKSGKSAPAAAKPVSEDADMDVSQAIPELDLPAVSLKLAAAAGGKPGASARPGAAPARGPHGGALKWMDDAGGGAARKPAPAPAPAAKPAAAPAGNAKPASPTWQTMFDSGDAAVKKPK